MENLMIANWKAAILVPVVDTLWPQGILVSICRFALFSPIVAFELISWWTLVGYIDMLTVSDNYNKFSLRFYIYLSTLFCRRAVFWSWTIGRFTISFIWNHLGTTVAARLFLMFVPRSILHWIFLWTGLATLNLVYGFLVLSGVLWESARRFLTRAVRLIIIALLKYSGVPPPIRFTYAQAPAFDHPQTQLRLLKLHQRIPFSELSGELLTYELLDAPPYYAVSYVWSYGPQDIRSITLNGMELHVRGNVYDILRRCSSYFREYYIWIDTICIDQSNVEEKTEQVRIMRDIYSKSEHVLVCLGEGKSGYAMSLVRELLFLHQLFGNEYIVAHVVHFMQRKKHDLLLRARIKGLMDLLRHPWFRRVWVVQEVVVARRATFFYGCNSIQWLKFFDWLEVIISGPLLGSYAMLLDEQQPPSTAARSFLGVLSMPFIVGYQREYNLLGARELSHVLRIFGEKQATYSIDKVFALIGIAKSDPLLTKLIGYKYADTDEALLKLALYFVNNGEALELLDLAGIGWGGRTQGLPSWAVDWTTMRAGLTLKRSFSSSQVRYRATKDMSSSVTEGSSQREIAIRGQSIDQIKVLVPLTEIRAGHEWTLMSYLKKAEELAQRYAQDPYPYSGNQPLNEAVWRTLIGDRSDTERPAPSSYGEALRIMMETSNFFYQNLQEIHTGMSFDDLRLGDIEATFGPTQRQQVREAQQTFQKMDLLFDFGEGVTPCVFCVTEKGYIGMVPQLSRVGDSICLIFGLEMPYVLRHFEGADKAEQPGAKYQLVGGSYIHGIMNGEALAPEEAGEDFSLV